MSERSPPDEIPAPAHSHPPRACPHCGGTDLKQGLLLYLYGETGNVGFKYESSASFLGIALPGHESLRADVCNVCGTVARFYVHHAGRKWA